MPNQISIKRSVAVEGLNVYNGRRNTVTFRPKEEDSGLVFVVNGARVPAILKLANHKRGTIVLDDGQQRVHLIEHLLSAVYALGIDNIEMELSDNVCPTTDNCAHEYFEALRDLRIEQKVSKKFWKYVKDVETHIKGDEERKPDRLSVNSADGFVIDYFAYYPHHVVGEQRYIFDFNEDIYARDVANARSPAFISDGFAGTILRLANKLFWYKGINERNSLLITSEKAERYANPAEFGVRYCGKEFVRHKLLDVLGTLALTGRHFVDTEFKFEMTGHRFDLYAMKKLFSAGCFGEYVKS